MDEAFTLHERLAADSMEVGRWPLNLVLLMNDASYPWLILVPRRPGLRDLHELAPQDQPVMMAEMVSAAGLVQSVFQAEKMNVAALGNQVPQLHVHVVARFAADPAWPNPVWGVQAPRHYGDQAARERLAWCARRSR
jgi:diadenosine tetraphosphate (Ap4A) HIT family hydrolase